MMSHFTQKFYLLIKPFRSKKVRLWIFRGFVFMIAMLIAFTFVLEHKEMIPKTRALNIIDEI